MTNIAFASSRRFPRALPLVLLGPLLLLVCAPSHAQDMTDAGAHMLDAEGTALLNQGQLAAACPKLEASFRLKPGTGVLLRLALCQERSGKLASALASYLEAAQRANAAGNQRIVQLAQNRAAALAPRISHLTLELDPEAEALPDLRLSRDGAPLEMSAMGADQPVDPGSHVITAVAPGRKRFEKTIVVGAEPQRYSIAIALPLEVVEVQTKPAAKLQRVPSDATQASWSAQQSLALAAGGIGITGLTAGTFLGLTVGSRMRRARAGCSDGSSGCSEDALRLQDQARGYAWAATIALGLGTASLLGGVALWLTVPHRPERPLEAQVRLLPILAEGAGGIQAVGTW